ncbi:three-helix bundle dimerization domain-containing protein [Streptomyces griseiscabiei]|uniref:Uncharacterized protein n=1 Tax=Streptomyces griseiscabiei TaxID=2993540 RepID=A0ABU4L1E9_9ACTN|nr:hypothetical protein [Streptomyces griseiscabiei]MBZ3905937.1 hypothetical protein [Streptomyces griseiscabiei]MDX2909567.1 hypothetical protein [Streptomyces griseiscabiei]
MGISASMAVEEQLSQDELASVRNMAARLSAAFPSVDPATVEATVRAAYDSFRLARVRAYVPILAERRARKALGAKSG